MRAYSGYDLLGKQLGFNDYVRTDLFSRFFDWIEQKTFDVSISIEIPNLIYLKTEVLCEAINDKYKDYDVEIYADYLVGSIYRQFITKAYNNKHGMKHAYDVLMRTNDNTPLVIRNPMKNEICTYQNPITTNMYIETIHLTKKWVKKGELLLFELDELYGHDLTVENLIQNIWIDFVNERKNSSEKKIINEIIDMLEELDK